MPLLGGEQSPVIVESPNVDAGQSDRRRHAVAVRVQLGERSVPHRRDVRLDAVDHVVQVARWDAEGADGVGQCREDGVRIGGVASVDSEGGKKDQVGPSKCRQSVANCGCNRGATTL